MQHQRSLFTGLPKIVSAGCLLVVLGCDTKNDDITPIQYLCGNSPPAEATAPRCGEGDPNLTPEPYVADGRGGWPPADPTDPACVLNALGVKLSSSPSDSSRARSPSSRKASSTLPLEVACSGVIWPTQL